ncbi:Transcriptional regulator prz1 [Mycena venus]|uniref:Transcriptional regulator prz1 n=1 Tax=Mycena venus TaxID=2733690 RepID=A0A8H7D1B5_9AGAR|nr:Transcriptional regulator prz1 [Mycena venus]
MADVAPIEAAPMEGQEEEEEGDWDGDYEEEEDEDDLAAYAAEARRAIEEQLFSSEKAAPAPVPAQKPPNPKEQAAVATVRAILASLERDSLAQSTLAASKVPEFSGDGLLDILRNIAGSGKIPRGVALPISRFLVTLAKSEVLFGSLRHSDASSLHLKRKREEVDAEEHANKRLRTNHPLYVEVAEAVRVISQTITTSQTLGPPVISTIQPHLHRIFLFTVSSSTVPGANTSALQEVSGLIQVLGVLSGIQIGQESQDIPTAVYPCLADGCGKFFERLYSLRAHQRVHNETGLSWKCAGCSEVFPLRDAIQKHKAPAVGNQPKAECVTAEIVEVQASGDAKMASVSREAEEGELEKDIISEIQTTVLGLHPLLQAHVARALGASPVQATPASNGQATLAGVIAQAQVAQARGSTNDASVATNPSAPASAPASTAGDSAAASLSVYGLSDVQTKQLKEAVNNAASAAQAEAEAQAALEEDGEDANEEGGTNAPPDASSIPPLPP